MSSYRRTFFKIKANIIKFIKFDYFESLGPLFCGNFEIRLWSTCTEENFESHSVQRFPEPEVDKKVQLRKSIKYWSKGTHLTMHCSNIFDRDPPSVIFGSIILSVFR